MPRTNKLVFTCGDPAGVGPEIIQSWIAANSAAAREVAIVGAKRWLESFDLHGAMPIAVGDTSFRAEPGKPTIEGARVAFAALEKSAALVRAGEYDGVVTAPVSKGWLAQAGYPFPGQTEFFADRWGGDATMAFCGGKLRVALLTWHIPLRDVPAQLSREAFARTVKATARLALACQENPSPNFVPRIGVCGLNPHAGENGLLGTEERDTIDPILDELRKSYPGLSRSEPGDTLFARQLKGEFDAIIALYHDQGLAPLKTLDFDESVNVTLGLPHVRTSPDHGTAFGIAGKGQASARSFSNAVDVARRLLALPH
ncbi:MAG TPA: 4-hydroxythreonine-4-phosphate dehydrogenase PdxA [Opitutaceae bacterium]|nr:4-hydroxythreonine-4-phosphate dehydrogenase PdxA [Opitutaceae bacterium]